MIRSTTFSARSGALCTAFAASLLLAPTAQAKDSGKVFVSSEKDEIGRAHV